MKNRVNKEYTHLELVTAYEVPSLYQVVLHNDDFTPMEFVVEVLEKFFFMERVIATKKMLEVHTVGKASCGVFSKDVAETKIESVLHFAKQYEHPLLCSLEVV